MPRSLDGKGWCGEGIAHLLPPISDNHREPLATQGSLLGGKVGGVKEKELFLRVPKPR